MKYTNPVRILISAAAIVCVTSLIGLTANAQDKAEAKAKTEAKASEMPLEKSAGRDPFRKYQAVVKPPKGSAARLEAPPIQVRIERYRQLRAAAASAHVAAPKPTTALLLSEVQVTGIFRTPRGWSAMVEAMPLNPKLSYVIYPGESFFDGQLVAIEEGRLVFRRDTVWTDGRREKSVEIKPLRTPSPFEALTESKTSATDAAAAEAPKSASAKQ
jgi:hypothetical protein